MIFDNCRMLPPGPPYAGGMISEPSFDSLKRGIVGYANVFSTSYFMPISRKNVESSWALENQLAWKSSSERVRPCSSVIGISDQGWGGGKEVWEARFPRRDLTDEQVLATLGLEGGDV